MVGQIENVYGGMNTFVMLVYINNRMYQIMTGSAVQLSSPMWQAKYYFVFRYGLGDRGCIMKAAANRSKRYLIKWQRGIVAGYNMAGSHKACRWARITEK